MLFTYLFLKILNREASSARSRPEEVLKQLRVSEGQAVADLGSGGGYFTLVFASKTGAAGRVYAVDVEKKYLDFIKRQAKRAGLGNIVLVLADKGEADLPKAGLDLIFARNVFHHLPEPPDYCARLKKYLKPGGKVAIVEHKKKGFIACLGIIRRGKPLCMTWKKPDTSRWGHSIFCLIRPLLCSA